jgi:FG-GAP-like repeat
MPRLLRIGLLIAVAGGAITAALIMTYRLRSVPESPRQQPDKNISAAPAPSQASGSQYKCATEGNPVVAHGGGTLQVNGFVIEVKPATDACHISIRSPNGEIIFDGDNDVGGIDIDPITGKDLNGDGEPDAVVVDDSGSVHYDDYLYSIISLGQKPGPIQQVEGIVHFMDLNGDGKMEIIVADHLLGLHGLSTPDSPSALLVLRLQGSTLEEVGADFTNFYDDEIKQDLADLKKSNVTVAREPNEQTKVLSIVLDYLYSGRSQQARSVLDQFWPADDRESVRKDIVEEYCGGYRKRLGLATDSVCKAGDF